jgi:aspartyl/glutamyl-tRNA(Asn/Gln) amidotransferase C subunit
MTDETNVLREDVVEAPITQAEALKNAPSKDMYYFRVPKVIKQ